MGWLGGLFGGDAKVADEAGASAHYYSAADQESLPVAHAVPVAACDGVRPPPMNPAHVPAGGSSTVAVPSGVATAPAAPATKIISTRTYTIPAPNAPPPPVVIAEFTRQPMVLPQCPCCRQWNARTRTRTYPSMKTWFACIVLLLVFWPLCWVPLVLDPAKQTDHYCLACGKLVGSVRPYANCCVTARA